jgi:hypothetical protein
MMRTTLITACAAAALFAYVGGRMFGAPTSASAADISLSALKVASLPDASRLARETRAQMDMLPPTIWKLSGPQALDENSFAQNDPVTPYPEVAVVAQYIPPPAPPKPAEPNPAEIAAAFGKSIAAFARTNGRYEVVIVDRNAGERRVLAVGDTYKSGWKVAGIQNGSVKLRKRSQSILAVAGRAGTEARQVVMANADGQYRRQTPTRPNNLGSTPSLARKRISRRDAARN